VFTVHHSAFIIQEIASHLRCSQWQQEIAWSGASIDAWRTCLHDEL